MLHSDFLFLLILVVIIPTKSQPVLIRSGVLKDHARDLQGGVFDYGTNRGISSYVTDGGYNDDIERKQIGNLDAGRYSQALADGKHFLQEQDFANNNFYNRGAGGLSNIDRQSGHNVGHHNTGFTNSYHKDETGNKSNFYDISNDSGDKLLKNSQQGLYGDLVSNRNRGTNYDGGKYLNDNSRIGVYDNQGLFDKNFGTKRNYNQQHYNDGRSVRGQSNSGDRIGEAGRYIVEDYREPYYRNFGYSYPGYHHTTHGGHIPIYENTYEEGLHSNFPIRSGFGSGHFQKGFYY